MRTFLTTTVAVETSVDDISIEDLIAPQDMVVTFSHGGYVKSQPLADYRAQRRGGKGKIGMGIKDEDFVETLFTASTHDSLLFFTDAGKVFWLKVHEIPEASRGAKGKALVNLLALAGDEKVTATVPGGIVPWAAARARASPNNPQNAVEIRGVQCLRR